MNTRILKSLRDLGLNRSRTVLLVASVAVGVTAAGGMLGAFTVIDREIDASFASTRPADAVVTVEGDAREWAGAARAVPGVAAVEPRAELLARMTGEPGWQRITLVVVDDWNALSIGRFFAEDDAPVPDTGEMWIERASLTEVDVAIGDHMAITAPGGADTPVTVVGLAHDPGRTPAWMFGNVVAYISAETAQAIGYEQPLSTLLIRGDEAATRADNLVLATTVAARLEGEGATVTDTTAPVPGEHPASAVMNTLLFLLQGFGVVTLVASTALVATLVATQMNQQRREIALMKTTGATAAQVGGIYITSAVAVSAAGLVVGIPLGLALTWGLSTFAFSLLNLDAGSFMPSAWVIPAQMVVALLVPILAVAIPVARRSRVPVRTGLSGAVASVPTRGRISRVASRWGRAVDLGVRNATRGRGRLALNAIALGVGAAAFMGALNTGAAWDAAVTREFDSQHFDVEVTLAQPASAESVVSATTGVDGITDVESWSAARAVATHVNGTDTGPTSSFLLYVPPADAASVTYPLLEGRWLEPGDDHALVITQNLDDTPIKVGDRIRLDGDRHEWTVVGRVVQLSGDREGIAYASEAPESMPGGDLVNAIRITGPSIDAALEAADTAFADAGLPVAAAVTADDAKESLDDHLFIITGLLLAMAVMLSLVGTLGLVESIGTAALERRREIGVAQAVGASTRQTLALVMSEALVITAVAWAAGAVLSWPLTAVLESAVGAIFTGAPLPFTVLIPGVLLALVAMLATAAVTSAVPGLEAADRPVRESLAHE